jgi:hypothetical protein
MIILGAVAAVYLLVMLFRLASLALPVYSTIGAGLWMLEARAGYGASIAVGLFAGILLLLIGRGLCAVLPPLLRLPAALAFAVPAAFAGYQAVNGIAGLMLAEGPALTWLALAGACAAAIGAWQSLGAAASAASSVPSAEPLGGHG